jgi:hypothetical protein
MFLFLIEDVLQFIIHPIQDILCSTEYQSILTISNWIHKYSHQWIIPSMDLNIILQPDSQVNMLILPFNQILPLLQSDIRIRYIWTIIQPSEKADLLQFLERDQLKIALEQHRGTYIEIFCNPHIEIVRFPKHIDPNRVRQLFDSDIFAKEDLFQKDIFYTPLVEPEPKEPIHDPLGIFAEKEAPIVCKMHNPFQSTQSAFPSLSSERHDPLGIFSSDEKPVICKMHNPFSK